MNLLLGREANAGSPPHPVQTRRRQVVKYRAEGLNSQFRTAIFDRALERDADPRGTAAEWAESEYPLRKFGAPEIGPPTLQQRPIGGIIPS